MVANKGWGEYFAHGSSIFSQKRKCCGCLIFQLGLNQVASTVYGQHLCYSCLSACGSSQHRSLAFVRLANFLRDHPGQMHMCTIERVHPAANPLLAAIRHLQAASCTQLHG